MSLGHTKSLHNPGTSSASTGSGISSKYLTALQMKGFVGAGLIRDLSPTLATLWQMPALTDAKLYAVENYATVEAGANLGMILSRAQVDLSCTRGRNVLLNFCVNKATPAATEPILGWGDGTNPGFNLGATSAGKLNVAGFSRLEASPATITAVNMAASTANICDKDCSIGFFMNNQTQKVEIFSQGVFSNQISFARATGRSEIPQLQNLVIGGIGGDNQTTYAAKFRGLLQVLILPDNFQDVGTLCAMMAANPDMPLTGAHV